MQPELIWILASMVLIAGSIATIMLIVRRRAEEDGLLPEPVRPEADPRTSSPPEAPGTTLTGVAPRDPPSPMEQREQAMAEASRAGRCMYCNEPAEHPYPEYRRVRSVFDPVLRWLGVKQLDRWRVSLGVGGFFSAKIDHVVCTAHQQRIVGLLEEHQAQETRDIARTLNEQARSLYEYGVSQVHATVTEEMRILRDPRAKKKQEKRALGGMQGGNVVPFAERQASTNGTRPG